ncbi:c-type cytochrome biogenesis protein CcmI [Pseudohongiella acticola]|nr:c-type cytochrome biogenesis protein CcmI [Pseudohongiella acticola]
MFWIVSLLLMLLAVLFVLVPVVRFAMQQKHAVSGGQFHRDSANLMIFEERLAELDAEREGGALDDEQYQALKAELQRTLLADIKPETAEKESAPARAQTPGFSALLAPSRLLPVLTIVLMLPLAFYLYGVWGFERDLEIADVFERSRDNQGDPEELRDLIFELGAIIEEDARNGWAWYYLARHLVSLGQINEAAQAFERAAANIENEQDRAIVLGQYAQAAYISSGQQITQEVQAIIDQAQRLNPAEQSVLQLLGADAFVNENYQGAITYWQQLLGMSRNQDDRQFLQQMMAEAQQRMAAAGETIDSLQGPRVEISLSLQPELEFAPDTRVFVSARNVEMTGPPLAAQVLTVADLPAVVSLSDANAVGPFNLSSAEEVTIVATVSLSGSADVQSGDFQVRSPTLQLSDDEPVRLQMQIADALP